MEKPKKFLENSPIFKRWWDDLVERVTLGYVEAKAKQEAATRRIPILLALLILAGAYLVYANGIYPRTTGAYCDYPDPFGQ